MLRLIIIFLIIFIFIRIYKHLSFTITTPGGTGGNQFNNAGRNNQKQPPFEDVEEAEFVEIKDKEEKKQESKAETKS